MCNPLVIHNLKNLILKEKEEYKKKLAEYENSLIADKEDSKKFVNHIEKIDGKLARAYNYFDNILFELGKSIKLNLISTNHPWLYQQYKKDPVTHE